MRIRWFAAARADLLQIRRFIEDQDHPAAAQSVARRILSTATYLRDHPAIGRPGRVAGTREAIIAGLPYIIPYRVRDGVLEILRVLHSSRQWPKEL
jgi:toxin ParE1/3/4